MLVAVVLCHASILYPPWVCCNYALRARGHDIFIVRTYADEGKSGLSLDGRDALKRLIEDVQAKRTDFTTILVYDVSRWGRFQDTDASAYYEYHCRLHGIDVRYVKEAFGSMDGPLDTCCTFCPTRG